MAEPPAPVVQRVIADLRADVVAAAAEVRSGVRTASDKAAAAGDAAAEVARRQAAIEAAVAGFTAEHEWDGSRVRFRNPDGGWGPFVEVGGPSAYLLAVSRGFAGSLDDWLASLRTDLAPDIVTARDQIVSRSDQVAADRAETARQRELADEARVLSEAADLRSRAARTGAETARYASDAARDQIIAAGAATIPAVSLRVGKLEERLPPPFQIAVDGAKAFATQTVDRANRVLSTVRPSTTGATDYSDLPRPFQIAVDGLAAPELANVDKANRLIGKVSLGAGGAAAARFGPEQRQFAQDPTTGAQIDLSWIPPDLTPASRPTLACPTSVGQSILLGGTDGSPPGKRVFSTTPFGRNLTPREGPWPRDNRGWSDLVGAVETVHRAGAYGETGTVATINVIAKRVHDAFGQYPLLATLMWGAGGTELQNLDRGSDFLQDHLTDLRKGKAYANLMGWDFVVPWTFIRIGNESGGVRSIETCVEFMLRFARDYETDVREITGQTQPVIFYVDVAEMGRVEPNRPFSVILAQSQMNERSAGRVRVLGNHVEIPAYDGTHKTNAGQYQMGRRVGEEIWIDFFCGPQNAFKPCKHFVSGPNTIDLEFEPWVGANMVIDRGPQTDGTAQIVTEAGNATGLPMLGCGFAVNDLGGATSPEVTGIKLLPSCLFPNLGNTRTRLTLSSIPSGSFDLNHGTQIKPEGATAIGRTWLRDEAEWISDRDLDGDPVSEGATPFVARHWVIPFQITFKN